MTEKRSKSPASAAKGHRKHAAPTIDLTATEVQQHASQPEAQQEAAAAHEPVAPEPVEHEAAATEPAAPERSEHAQAAPKDPAPEKPEWKKPASDAARPAADGNMIGAVLGGVVGAAVVALLLGGLWLSGVLPGGDDKSSASQLSDKVTAQIAALEKQVGDLQRRPSGAPAADPALAKRVADAENAMKSLGVALAALNRRGDEIAAKAAQADAQAVAAEKTVTELRASLQDVSKTAQAGALSIALESLQKRIAELEQSAKAAKDEIAKIAVAAPAPDTSARLALTAAALRDAVLRGQPYAQELAQAKSLGADDKTLAPLARFAATGVPSDKTLAQELDALLPAMIKAGGAPKPSGSFIERLQANAEKLVRIRPLDAPVGSDSATVLARIESEIVKADIAGILADVGKLPEPVRQVAADWVTRASARQQALAAARQFAAVTARALGSK
jgi:hypothetical protein